MDRLKFSNMNDIALKQRKYQAGESLVKAECEEKATFQNNFEKREEFLTIVSHELKTPINVISTALQALDLFCGDEMSDKAKKYINIIRQNTYRQMRLVNNILDAARANEGLIKIHKVNMDIVKLTRAITESVYGYAAHKGVKIGFFSNVGLKVIGIDDEKYERILLNLLSNAIKFTPKDKSICINLTLLKDKLLIEVKDSGIGIPADKLDVIFQRFGQVDNKLPRLDEGSGIGLPFVKAILQALGGSISVKSEIGKGTTFSILLPDEIVEDEQIEMPIMESMKESRITESAKIEFSDIYL